ncbi:MAG: T9SS type A sorting domain-containing protein [Bacteroidales bacterium]|nr:T9SS type A sorting domain-containing protein [Bacteroidales bacterium]MCF8405459.1 T9SS type A sorting domain-containing protein [Bacteroidales bacterium]
MKVTLPIILFLITLADFIVLSSFHYPDKFSGSEKSDKAFLAGELPTGFNSLFAGSGECVLCHSTMTNTIGESISITNEWRSSMMANSSKDPLWRAKVSHETLVNPEHAEVLEDVCTKCHAPLGNVNAHHNGQNLYSIAEMVTDPLALDGGSCTVCHQIPNSSLGQYSGNFEIGTNKIIWGQYEEPFANPMVSHTGYTPTYGNHIRDSKICGSCHTLLTSSVDLEGEPTGSEFVEQAIYHEWLNSDFPASETSCQSCHIPEISDEVSVSSMPPWLNKRTPFGMHQLVGANVFMLRMLKENIDALALTTDEIQLDSTISRSTRMLQNYTLDLNISSMIRTQDSLFVDVSIHNKAGHKFPTGFPSRRAFVSFIVTDTQNDTLFQSGKTDENFNLIQEDSGYETHFNTITDENQVQIYELVMGDVNSDVTTVLERAYVVLKDNRIPPEGFTSSHLAYDTVRVEGFALIDNDFNRLNNIEGSGTDVIHYRIPTMDFPAQLNVKVLVYYQTVNDKWLQHMFTYSSEEIGLFQDLYNQADKTPLEVASVTQSSFLTGNSDKNKENLRIYPNPAGDQFFISSTHEIKKINVFTLDGKQLNNVEMLSNVPGSLLVKSPSVKGIVLVKCVDGDGNQFSQKLFLR